MTPLIKPGPQKNQTVNEKQPVKTPAARKPAARFHNFNQRSYDYSNMEVELVRKLQSGNNQ